jgi:hypothetical protein
VNFADYFKTTLFAALWVVTLVVWGLVIAVTTPFVALAGRRGAR